MPAARKVCLRHTKANYYILAYFVLYFGSYFNGFIHTMSSTINPSVEGFLHDAPVILFSRGGFTFTGIVYGIRSSYYYKCVPLYSV